MSSLPTPRPDVPGCHAAEHHGIHAHALTPVQERRLLDNLDERFLELTRNLKKRHAYPPYISELSSTTPTLTAYLAAARPLLVLILQIPPRAPSASLRTALLLHLSGDVLHAVPGYAPSPAALRDLLHWLALLDQGWLAVLRAQAWDPLEHRGVPLNSLADADNTTSLAPAEPLSACVPSQTERARLRSLLVTGTSALEEWLASYAPPEDVTEDYGEALARMGLQQGFDELFMGTLGEIGVLRGAEGEHLVEGMTGTC